MWDIIKEFGIGGVIGLLIGLGIASWVDTTTNAGTGILIVVCVLVFGAFGQLLGWAFGKKNKNKPDDE
jgi:hypothetical protein